MLIGFKPTPLWFKSSVFYLFWRNFFQLVTFLQNQQAVFYTKVLKEARPCRSFFRVAFYGQSFPQCLMVSASSVSAASCMIYATTRKFYDERWPSSSLASKDGRVTQAQTSGWILVSHFHFFILRSAPTIRSPAIMPILIDRCSFIYLQSS